MNEVSAIYGAPGNDLVVSGFTDPVPIVRIDWDYFMARRQAILAHSDLPPYLLLPEIQALIGHVLQADKHLLFNTLWHTGARISEALTLTRESFILDDPLPYVSIQTAKKRGRPKRGKQHPPRMVPITDPAYLRELASYFASHPLKKGERLWPVTRQTAFRWTEQAVSSAVRQGQQFSIPIGPHTFRHSFAVNTVLHWIPIPALQAWLGHSRRESTEIYTQVLSAETGHLMSRVEY